MEYKPGFEEMVPRMEAWWRGEMLDRACLAVTAPNGRPRRRVPAPPTPRERRTNIGYLLDRAEAGFEATHYAGEAVPRFMPDLGPDCFASFLGAELEFTETSSWAKRCIESWDEIPDFEIRRDSFEWSWHVEAYAAAAERARGRYFLAAPDCHSGGDCLLAMRGGAELCMDLYDHPDAVKAAMRRLERAVAEFHAAWWPLIERSGQRGHVTAWLATWSPGRSNATQLDLLAMISPDQFREFFRRELEVQFGALENTIFHLDGPDAAKHLPALIELADVSRPGSPMRAVQWVPGAGALPMTRWIGLLKEIQSYGLGLHVGCAPGEVETLLRELSSKGLFLRTHAESREEADGLVSLAERLAHE